MADHEAELAVVDMRESADRLEQYLDDDGKPAMRLMPRAQVGRGTAIAGDEADTETVLEALLGTAEAAQEVS